MTKQARHHQLAQIGQRIRARRLELGLSQGALAERLDIRYQQLQRYEKGVSPVPSDRLPRLAAALSLPLSALLETSSDRVPAGDDTLEAEIAELSRTLRRIEDPRLRALLLGCAAKLAEF